MPNIYEYIYTYTVLYRSRSNTAAATNINASPPRTRAAVDDADTLRTRTIHHRRRRHRAAHVYPSSYADKYIVICLPLHAHKHRLRGMRTVLLSPVTATVYSACKARDR